MVWKRLVGSRFIKDNFYLFFGTSVMSAFAFFFHFYMGRVLGPEGYGVLGVLLALVGFITIPLQTLQVSIAKFSAALNIKGKKEELAYLYDASLKKLNKLFLLLFFVSLGFNFFLSSFLGVDYWLLFVVSLMLLLVPILSVSRGFLQGLQMFKGLAISLSLEGISKFFLGVFIVLIGFDVGGAITAVAMSFLFVSIYNYVKLKNYVFGKIKKFETEKLYTYVWPVLLTLILLVSFYSIDLVLVKHFFNNVEAGYYAVINLMGKIVLFVSFSIIDVMFPKAVELRENGKSHNGVLLKSFILMLIMLVPLIGGYFLFGEFLVGVLFGESYSTVGSLIGFYGLFMGGVALSKLFCMYLLSFRKFVFIYFLVIANIFEILLIFLRHESLAQVVYSLALLGVSLFVVTAFISFLSGKNINTL